MTASTAADLTPEERAAVQQRVLRVLTGGQVVGSAGLGAAVTVGAFVVQDILGAQTPWAGISTATVTMGTAFTAQVLSRMMRRKGRRPGLQTGYGLAVVGAIICAVGAEHGWLSVFLLGLFVFGNGQAANLLARYAATDLAEPTERASAMSRIVFASTFGAVLGPLVIGPTERAGQAWFGFAKYTGPWLFGAVIFFLAFLNTAIRLRPDPLVLAGGVGRDDGPKMSLQATYRSILAGSRSRLALAAMVISHVTMVGVMTMTPVHMKLHGHETLSQYVVSLHIAGMYAFAPFVGRFADRKGREPAILVGGVVLVLSTVLAAVSGESYVVLFPALWALGLGWNFGLIGGSSLLVESMPADQRVQVQGAADMAMSFCGGLAGFSSGFIRKAIGYHLLSTAATVVAGGLLVIAYSAWLHTRRPAAATVAG